MWYTGIGSGARLSAKESALLHELGVCLAEAGWSLRAGGRGVVDDVLHQAVQMVGGKVKVTLPFAHYRGYTMKEGDPSVCAFSEQSVIYQERALSKVEAPAAQMKILSPLQKNLLASTVPLLLGEDFETPSRFVLTWHKLNRQGVITPPDKDALFHTQEGPLFHLASHREIPVFNLDDPLHYQRVEEFIKQHRCASAING